MNLLKVLDFGPYFNNNELYQINSINCAAIAQEDLIIYDLHNDQLLYQYKFLKLEELDREKAIQVIWDQHYYQTQRQPDLLVKTTYTNYIIKFKNEIEVEQISNESFEQLYKKFNNDIIQKVDKLAVLNNQFINKIIHNDNYIIIQFQSNVMQIFNIKTQTQQYLKISLLQQANKEQQFELEFQKQQINLKIYTGSIVFFKIYDIIFIGNHIFILLSINILIKVNMDQLLENNIKSVSLNQIIQKPANFINNARIVDNFQEHGITCGYLIVNRNYLQLLLIFMEQKQKTCQKTIILQQNLNELGIDFKQQQQIDWPNSQTKILKYCWGCGDVLQELNETATCMCNCGAWFL